MSLDNGEFRNFQANSGLHNGVGENRNSINGPFLETIDFLTGVQLDLKSNLKIDEKGRIDRGGVGILSQKYGGNELIRKMDNKALEHYKKVLQGSNSGFTDIVVSLGALVLVYDSSKQIPKGFENKSRGDKKLQTDSGITYSVIAIDINPNNRGDGVNPNTSLHHEFQHHLNSAIGDQLLSGNNNLGFSTLNRDSDYSLKFKSRAEYLSQDEEEYSKLFGRKVTFKSHHPAVKTVDYQNYERQLFYLDELSASWGQGKNNVWGPMQMFYNNAYPGNNTHYNLIGTSDIDKEKLKILFRDYLMPGMYLFSLKKALSEKLKEEENKTTSDNILESIKREKIRELKEKLVNIEKLIALITQAIGTSRTINQALEIVGELWEKRIKPALSDKQLEYLYEGGKMLNQYL